MVAAEDTRALTASFQELEVWHDDVRADLAAQISSLDNTLLRFSARGDEWLDDSLRLGNVFSLLREQDVRDGFERDVVKGYAAELDARVAQVVSWLAEKSARQSILTVEQLRERVAALKRRGAGGARGGGGVGEGGGGGGGGGAIGAAGVGSRSMAEHDLIRGVDPYAAVRADPWLLGAFVWSGVGVLAAVPALAFALLSSSLHLILWRSTPSLLSYPIPSHLDLIPSHPIPSHPIAC